MPERSAAGRADTDGPDRLPLALRVRRERLLRAMAVVCARDGYQAATVGQVCREAGVPRATFRRVFGDRERCFLEVLRDGYGQFEARLRGACERADSGGARVRACALELVAIAQQQPELAYVCVVQAAAGGPAGIAERRRALDQLAAIVEDHRDMLHSTAIAVVATAMETVHTQLTTDKPLDPAEFEDAVLRACLAPRVGARAAAAYVERWSRVRGDAPVLAAALEEEPWPPRFRLTLARERALAYVAANGGASNGDVQRAFDVSHPSQVSRQLAWLEEHGLVTRRRFGRRNAWEATDRARRLLRLDDGPGDSPDGPRDGPHHTG